MHDQKAGIYLAAQVWGLGVGTEKRPKTPAPPQGMRVKSEAQDPGDFHQLSPCNLQRMNRLSPRVQPGSSLSL